MPGRLGFFQTGSIKRLHAYKHIDQIGANVVIIGGGSIGCELGLHLAREGKRVNVVEIGPVLNRTLNDIMKTSLSLQMKECSNLITHIKTAVQEIKEKTVVVKDSKGNIFEVAADTVIFAAGMRSRKDEANTFFGITQDTNIIGDANRVGTIWTASEDGYYIAAHL